MKRVTAILVAVAALLLMLPALLLGSHWYALVVAAISATAVTLLRIAPQSKWSDLLLIATSTVSALAFLVGVHPLFASAAIMLFIFAWNAGHRFGHFDRSPVADRAKLQFILQMLVFSLVPSLGAALVLSAFLYVRLPLTFGLGLGLSVGAFLVIALFIRLARVARKQED